MLEEKKEKKMEKLKQQKKSIAVAQTEALIKRDSQKGSTRQYYRNHGRIRLFRVRSRTTRIYLKMLGFCVIMGGTYFTLSTSNNYYVKLGFSNVGDSLIISKLGNIVGYFTLLFIISKVKRRSFLRIFHCAIAGNLTSSFLNHLFDPMLQQKDPSYLGCRISLSAFN
jgi:hypothetical protein